MNTYSRREFIKSSSLILITPFLPVIPFRSDHIKPLDFLPEEYIIRWHRHDLILQAYELRDLAKKHDSVILHKRTNETWDILEQLEKKYPYGLGARYHLHDVPKINPHWDEPSSRQSLQDTVTRARKNAEQATLVKFGK